MKTTAAALVALALLTLPACEKKPAPPPVADTPPSASAAQTAPDWVYTGIRGEVMKLPDAFGDLTLHHEHIPDFVAPMTGKLNVNKDGVTGMRSMTMPFEPAEGVDISSLQVGDKIEFDLAVWGKESARGLGFNLTRFSKLPPETVLDFTDKPSVELPAEPATDDGP